MTDQLLEVVVARREDQTDEISVFELVPQAGELPAFEAGAHIDVHLGPDRVRQYSLCSAPGAPDRYRLGVLRDPNSRGGSEQIHATLEEGSRLRIGAPRNHFPLDPTAAHSLLIGGGIGITPMIAMAYALKTAGKPFELHYCCRSESRAAFLEELEREFGNRLVLHFDDAGEAALLDPKGLCQAAEEGTHLYVCGPGGFMDWVIEQAKAAGLPDARIHFEYFSAEVETGGEAFEVVAAQSGVTVRVGADQTIAQALKAAGVRVELSCEQGVCGSCICDVLEGIPEHRDHFLSEEEREDNDQIAPCCSRAQTPRLVLDI